MRYKNRQVVSRGFAGRSGVGNSRGLTVNGCIRALPQLSDTGTARTAAPFEDAFRFAWRMLQHSFQ